VSVSTRILVPSGVLGLGFDREALKAGVALKPDAICIDGGSTDSGPFSLGTSTSKYSRAACLSEWRDLMAARAELDVPLIIGSAGTCGSDDMVDWMLEITREIVREQKQQGQDKSLSIALVYTEQDQDVIASAFKDGRINALEPDIGLDESPDIIIAGRTTDTAIISALPLANGCHPGASWHAAKIVECGALCSTHPTSGVIVVDIDDTGFTLYPLATNARCTPTSVSAHMLYENSDPFKLYEPGGYLSVTNAHYEAINERTVRVTGSEWIATEPYTVKLEGARLVGFQCTLLALLRDAHYVENAQAWVERLSEYLADNVSNSLTLNEDDFHIEFRLIGVNATLGALETKSSSLHEVGVLVIVTAQSQEMADEIGKYINPFLLHYPLTDNEPLPTKTLDRSGSLSISFVAVKMRLNSFQTHSVPIRYHDMHGAQWAVLLKECELK